MGLPRDTALSQVIMGLKEDEVMENSEGCGKAVRVTGCVHVCVCVWFKGVVYFGLMSLRHSF